MSRDTKLFQPPSYPEAPKDMWYQVPEKPTQPEPPKPIFPWEGRAPKPTRVFAESKAPSPPPEPIAAPADSQPSGDQSTELAPGFESPPPAQPIQSPDPWANFQSRSNAWDEVPEIERYMQSLQKPRKKPIQVLHQSKPQPTTPPGRKPSLKLTDFPTEYDRPSLPVTPMPVRRPTFWGDERDDEGNLPAAEGVPQQPEWVRQFSSYPVPDFSAFAPRLRTIDGVLFAKCQYCGKQNPIAKLEELQRRQTEAMMSPDKLEEPAEIPSRKMPESASRQAVEEADDKATSPLRSPKMLKPILKQPSFEVPAKEGEKSAEPTSTTDSSTEVGPTDAKVVSPTEHIENTKAPETSVTAPVTTVKG
jgi:hypothetical protein